MLLSFIALTPAQPSWFLHGVWLMPVIVLTGLMVVLMPVPLRVREVLRRLAAGLILATLLSAGLLASELIRQDVPQCASLEPYSAAWFAFGCWWPF